MPVIGTDDKRELTALLTISLSGELLPPQIIYAGKTNRCHSQYGFPDSWSVTHSPNHWSNEATMLEYCDSIVLPYLRKKRVHSNQKALIILDVFAAHRCETVKEKFNSMNCILVYVPAGCTGDLQPLDLAVNDEYKQLLKNCFIEFHANEIANENDTTGPYKLNTAIPKPLHAA